MIRLLSGAMALALLLPSIACDDDPPKDSTFEIGRDSTRPIPSLGNGEIEVSVAHVGYRRVEDRDEQVPSVGNVTVQASGELLESDPLMVEGDTLRFFYDTDAYELTLEEVRLADDPGDHRAVFFTERI